MAGRDLPSTENCTHATTSAFPARAQVPSGGETGAKIASAESAVRGLSIGPAKFVSAWSAAGARSGSDWNIGCVNCTASVSSAVVEDGNGSRDCLSPR